MNTHVSSLNSFELYLNTTRFVDRFSFTEQQKNTLITPSVRFINEPIAINETLTPSLQKTLKGLQGFLNDDNLTFNTLYKEYTKIIPQLPSNYSPYSFSDFVNGLSIFELVFSSFNRNLLKISIQMTSEESISVYFFNEQESESFSIYQSIISNQPSDSPSLMLNNMLFVFHLFSLCGKFSYGELTQSNYISNLNLYNKFFISHLNYGLLIHLGVMVYCNMIKSPKQSIKASNYDTNIATTIPTKMNTPTLPATQWTKKKNNNNNSNLNQSKKKFRSNNALISVDLDNNPRYSSSIKSSTTKKREKEKAEISICLLDNKIVEFQWNDCIKISQCLNSFKWFLFESIPNVCNAKLNMTIIHPIEISNTYFGKNFEATFYAKAIEKPHLSILSSKLNFNKILKAFPLNQMIIKLELSDKLDTINNLFEVYNPFMIKAKEIQVKDCTNETEEYIRIEMLVLEWCILEIILSKMIAMKLDIDYKKGHCSYSFLFNCWKMTINKSNSSNEIDLFYNYSNIQEKALFNYFTLHVNLFNSIRSITKIINLLEEFKGYDINIRLFQNNFRSKQLQLFLMIIVNAVTNHVIDNKLDNAININEKNFNYYIPSMQCYINDSNNCNKKHKLNELKQAFHKIILSAASNKHFRFLSIYLPDLSELFNIVVFSDNPNAFKLIRTFEDKKIFFILTKADTQHQLYANAIPNNYGQIVVKDYNLHIYVYINNNKESYLRTLLMLHSIKTDKVKKCNVEITVICDKNYLETTVLIEHKYKKLVQYLSEDVTNLYIIQKTFLGNCNADNSGKNNSKNDDHQSSVEYFNYDIYFTPEKIKLMTYEKFDFNDDPKYKRFLYCFISILSSSIEMILYILKNKDILISQFVFAYKNTNDATYFLHFKDGNLFIKKYYENDNLILLNVKNAIPLFCLISKKKTTSYTMSNENFFDVFPRLFLNLHKVNNDSNDNFNEVIFWKIHKNIFSDYYDCFYPISLSYEVFDAFNAFFLSNDYLKISKGELFNKGYLFAFEAVEPCDKGLDKMVIKKVIIFKSNIKMLSKENEATYSFFTFSKLDHLIESLKEDVDKKTKDNRKALCYLHRMFTQDNKSNVILIAKYIFNERVTECYIDKSIIEEKINEYLKDKENRENDRVENRITQLTEAAKYENIVNKDKNCSLI